MARYSAVAVHALRRRLFTRQAGIPQARRVKPWLGPCSVPPANNNFGSSSVSRCAELAPRSLFCCSMPSCNAESAVGQLPACRKGQQTSGIGGAVVQGEKWSNADSSHLESVKVSYEIEQFTASSSFTPCASNCCSLCHQSGHGSRRARARARPTPPLNTRPPATIGLLPRLTLTFIKTSQSVNGASLNHGASSHTPPCHSAAAMRLCLCSPYAPEQPGAALWN